MTQTSAQTRALRNYRARLAVQGLTRFEVLGRDSDRGMIRALAKRLAEGGDDANALRDVLNRSLTRPDEAKGGILAALRQSPLVGSGFTVERGHDGGRPVDIL